jgi:sec-independent protein translocase protein TatA
MLFGKLGEIVLILVVVALLFGTKKLPDVARSLGKSARILKSEAKAMRSEGKGTSAAEPDPTAGAGAAHRTIKAAPGDVTGARPVAEPAADRKTQR